MFRTVFAIIIGASVSAAALGAAASLTVNSGALQSGTDTTLQCDPDGVIIEFLNEDSDGSDVERVKIKGIHDNCIGAKLYFAAGSTWTNCGPIPNSGSTNNREVMCNPPDFPVTTTNVAVSIIGGGSTR